jgi:glycosyltransferase involved in cell wall biosynthesis
MISCLIVNYNCLQHTKNLVNDLKNQNIDSFELFIVDQNSIEEGTDTFLDAMKNNYTVIKNLYNRPLNHIWNDFVSTAAYPYCAFLNNDIRIPRNFLKDTVEIFEMEPDVSCVIHPTNHPDWDTAKSELSYDILEEKIRQGWDFSFRKSTWVDVPSVLDFYCGDDFIFENLYLQNNKVAVAKSSPIIHLVSQTRKSALNGIIPNRKPMQDIKNYKALGFNHYLEIPHKYSKIDPEINFIKEEH